MHVIKHVIKDRSSTDTIESYKKNLAENTVGDYEYKWIHYPMEHDFHLKKKIEMIFNIEHDQFFR